MLSIKFGYSGVGVSIFGFLLDIFTAIAYSDSPMTDAPQEIEKTPIWLLTAKAMYEAAESRGLIIPGICLLPPFGCGNAPATQEGFCDTCFTELLAEFGDL